MTKKKNPGTEETEQKGFNKETGNKENTIKQEEEKSINAEDQSPEEGIETEAKLAGEAETTDKFVETLKVAEEKLAELQDKYVRLSAEFDNYRRRTLREKMDLVKYSGEDILVKLLPVMDDFDRAIEHMDDSTDYSALKSGIDIIYTKFSEFLKQNGLKEIPTDESYFNVDLHEAVAKVPVPEAENKGKVIDVIQKGYYLQDKVVRFSKVVVGE